MAKVSPDPRSKISMLSRIPNALTSLLSTIRQPQPSGQLLNRAPAS